MTDGRERSLRKQHPRRHDIPLLLAASLILLPLGLVLPTVTISKAGGLSGTTYSVITAVIDLARHGNVFLALIIFSFSMLFPVIKLTMLIVIWFHGMKPERREEALDALKVLGKWSMLDVFVVVSLVGAIQFGVLATATPRIGIYLFSTAVLSCLLATFLESSLAHAPDLSAPARGRPSLAALPIALLALLLLGAGLDLPLMEMKKWVFWSREYSILGGVAGMFKAGQYTLAGMIVLFVILAPLGRLLGLIVLLFLRRMGSRPEALVRTLEGLDKWMMIDVFALGLLIVVIKIGGLAEVSPRSGLGCFVAAVFLSACLSWMIRTRPDLRLHASPG